MFYFLIFLSPSCCCCFKCGLRQYQLLVILAGKCPETLVSPRFGKETVVSPLYGQVAVVSPLYGQVAVVSPRRPHTAGGDAAAAAAF